MVGEEQLVEHQRGGGAVDQEVIPLDDGAKDAGPEDGAHAGGALEGGGAHGRLLSLRGWSMQVMYRGRSEPARFGILIYDGVEPIDIGGTVGVVSMARRVLPGVAAVVIARQAGPVALAGGLTVVAGFGIDDAPACDVVIVCGGPGWAAAAEDAAVLGYLQRLRPEGAASVCTGAMILGAAGVLDGLVATTRRSAVGAETEAPLTLLGRRGTVRAVVGGCCGCGCSDGRRSFAGDRYDAVSAWPDLWRGCGAGRGAGHRI